MSDLAAATAPVPPASLSANGKKVLLACELGGGMGHIDPLLRLVRGAGLTLATSRSWPLRNLGLAWPKVRQTPFPLMQAPVFYWQPLSKKDQNYGYGYADTLAPRTGFADVETLMPMVRAWEALLNLGRPIW